ncbi:MAG: hypothetical protein ACQET1_11620 [Gemmatimonadota bacterium]
MQSSEGGQREFFNTRVGFILAAVGSAVGLGNMWRFPYVAAEGGGAAFVFLYILLTLLVGIPLMLSEFSVGRGSRLAPIGALRKLGGGRWSLLGWMYVITGFLILAYYSVIAGWVVRYALDGLVSGFAADPEVGEMLKGTEDLEKKSFGSSSRQALVRWQEAHMPEKENKGVLDDETIKALMGQEGASSQQRMDDALADVFTGGM